VSDPSRQVAALPTTSAYIGLGSNVGDRLSWLQESIDRLQRARGVRVVAVSSVYESEPVGGPPGQGRFLNAAVEVHTTLSPDKLLETLHATEAALGRTRTERWGPRIIDLDLLLFGDRVHRSSAVRVPHEALNERVFVLAPLADLSPSLRDPVTGRSVRELLHACPSSGCRPVPGWTLRVPPVSDGA